MSNTKGKSIRFFMVDGTPQGILGRASNGRTEWKVCGANHKTYEQWQNERLAANSNGDEEITLEKLGL